MANLNQIGEAIRSRGMILHAPNQASITTVLDELGLACPSGVSVHGDKKAAMYSITTNVEGDLVISENRDNHNTDRMQFTNLPRLTYCLQADGTVSKEHPLR